MSCHQGCCPKDFYLWWEFMKTIDLRIWTQEANVRPLKSATILFDTGWNLIQWIISKIVCLVLLCKTSLILFYTTYVKNIVTHTIAKGYVLAKSMITNMESSISVGLKNTNSTKEEEMQQTSNSTELYAQKLCTSKKSYFNEYNFQSGQHNKIQHKVSRLCLPRMNPKSLDCWKDECWFTLTRTTKIKEINGEIDGGIKPPQPEPPEPPPLVSSELPPVNNDSLCQLLTNQTYRTTLLPKNLITLVNFVSTFVSNVSLDIFFRFQSTWQNGFLEKSCTTTQESKEVRSTQIKIKKINK